MENFNVSSYYDRVLNVKLLANFVNCIIYSFSLYATHIPFLAIVLKICQVSTQFSSGRITTRYCRYVDCQLPVLVSQDHECTRVCARGTHWRMQVFAAREQPEINGNVEFSKLLWNLFRIIRIECVQSLVPLSHGLTLYFRSLEIDRDIKEHGRIHLPCFSVSLSVHLGELFIRLVLSTIKMNVHTVTHGRSASSFSSANWHRRCRCCCCRRRRQRRLFRCECVRTWWRHLNWKESDIAAERETGIGRLFALRWYRTYGMALNTIVTQTLISFTLRRTRSNGSPWWTWVLGNA